MFHFIFNTQASSGQGLTIWNSIKGILDKSHIEYELHTPDSREHAIETVRSISERKNQTENRTVENMEHIVVIGGDGTLNTVIQGIEDFDAVTLSIIPAGSGNDFAKALKITFDPEKELNRLITSPEVNIIDYGVNTFVDTKGNTRVNRFLISSGTGYDADICEEVNRSKAKAVLNKLHLGQIVYLFIGLKKIFGFHNYIKKHECDANILLDDNREIHIDNMFLTVAMNTIFQGGGAPFCPMADWTDGYFDICAVDSMTTPKLLMAILLVYFKKHFIFKQVNHYKCKKIQLQMKKERWLHTDGETMGETKSILMECRHGLHFMK